MTSISVNHAAKNVQLVSGAKGTHDSRMTAKNFAGDNSFQSAIDMYRYSEDKEVSSQTGSGSVKTTDSSQQYDQKSLSKDCVRDSKVNQVKDKETLSEEELDAVEDAAEEIISQVAKELEVSEEEVRAALETLGMNVFDLGNANQMSALITELLGISDSMQIVTDGDLFASLTSLTQMADQVIGTLQDELQIPMEQVLMQLEEQIPVQQVPSTEEGNIAMTMQTAIDNQGKQFGEQVLDSDVDEALRTITTDHEAAQSGEMNVTEELGEGATTQVDMSTTFRQEETASRDAKQNLNQNPFAVIVEGGQASVVEGTQTPVFSYSMVDDIMNQIGDYIKTNVTADVKQMEIQLSPANLGTVHINLASKNGVVTAQIVTDNETVKNAVELQVVQLKERLESQGVKIEAVEVTVASHEFERNLDEKNENKETNDEVKKTSSRKWNLTDMDGEESEGDLLSEAEQVELDMMKLSGNQLNYMI